MRISVKLHLAFLSVALVVGVSSVVSGLLLWDLEHDFNAMVQANVAEIAAATQAELSVRKLQIHVEKVTLHPKVRDPSDGKDVTQTLNEDIRQIREALTTWEQAVHTDLEDEVGGSETTQFEELEREELQEVQKLQNDLTSIAQGISDGISEFSSVRAEPPGHRRSFSQETIHLIENFSQHIQERREKTFLELTEESAMFHGQIQTLMFSSFIVPGLCLLLALLLANILSRHFNSPIQKLLKFVQQIRRGDYRVERLEAPQDEFGSLTHSISDMAAEIVKSHETISQLLKRHQMILDNAGEGILGLDGEGKIIFINPLGAHLCGWRPEELIDQPIRSLFPPPIGEDEPDLLQALAIHAPPREQERSRPPTETTFPHRNGANFPAEFTHSAIVEDGHHAGTVVTFRDISQRKKLERRLQLSQFSLDHAGEAMFWIKPDSRFVFVNHQASVSLGYPPERLLTMGVMDIDADAAFTEATWPSHWEDLKQNKHLVFEVNQLRQDGSVVPCEVSANYFEFEGQEYNLAFVRDIRERRAAQEALLKHHEELERLVESRTGELAVINEELKHFLYIVSHDLRSPLVSIQGLTGELRLGLEEIHQTLWPAITTLEPDAREKLEAIMNEDLPQAMGFIESSASKMAHLIQALLNLSRLGRRTLRFESVDVAEVIRESIRAMAHTIEAAGITVTLEKMPHLVTDRLALEQIIGNLIDNAVKYRDPSRPGLIEITCSHHKDAITVHVRDQGRGIAAEDIPRVFQVFQRVGSQDIPGEGMGLAHVQTMALRLGGRVGCVSEPGKGSTFSVTLPEKSKN
ncbi:MAG: PAS domain S-box protein [Nitrospirae bacterium]|nr:PAS domain S-box protein [Magnetococcales bacterium]HAT49366.1 hypothetical protein [Alphaproteobacteria bacterium]